MLKHEFEVLLGRTVTDKSYVEANTMYMNAGEMAKEDFCREWLKIGHTSLAHALSDSVSELRKQLDKARQTIKNLKAEREAMVEKILDQWESTGYDEFREVAEEFATPQRILRYIIDNEIPLRSNDYDAIREILEKEHNYQSIINEE